MKMNLLVLRCRDLQSSKYFYERFGFLFVKEQHGAGPVHYSSQDAGFVFELYPLSEDEGVGNSRLGFSVEGVGHVLSHLNITGQYELNGKQIYLVRDPDGRTVELSEQKA